MWRIKGKGFSLVELLVVLVIIGILIALILPNSLRAIRQAQTRECASNIRSIDTAIQMYYSENQTWPTDMTALGTEYFADNTAPTCPFDVTYTFADSASGTGKVCGKTEHFSTWPTVHAAATTTTATE